MPLILGFELQQMAQRGQPLPAHHAADRTGRDINTNVVGKTPSKALVEGAIAMFDELTGVLGLVYNRKTETLDSDVEALIEARTNARKEKNWAEADRIRDQLKEMGIVLEDTAQGVKWHRE